MASVKANVDDFKRYMKLSYEVLKFLGKHCDDITLNILKGYKVMKYKNIKGISRKRKIITNMVHTLVTVN